MNTTYTSRLNPQFQSAGVQDVSANLKPIKDSMGVLIKQNEAELKNLRNIADDQAQIEFNRGAADLVKQYGTDYQGLDKAMLELENNLYQQIKPTHPDIAEDLLRKQDLVRMRAVDQARRENLRIQNDRIRKTSSTMLDGLEAAATDDFLIYLGEVSTKKPEERKPQNINPFLEDLRQYNAILDRKDADGNPIFTDSQISSRKGMKGVRMEAAYRYINSIPLDELKNFRNTTFQSSQWQKDTGFNMDDIHKLNSQIKSRIKELEDDENHEIQVRALQDTAGLINNGTDMVTIDRLKKSGLVPEDLIDDTVNASNKTIVENWYDPNKSSDPFGTLRLYSQLGELYKNGDDDTPEAMTDRIKGFVNIIDNVGLHQKDLNMPTEKYREYMEDISKTIMDKEFRENMMAVDVAGIAKKALPDDLQDLWGSKEFDKYMAQQKIVDKDVLPSDMRKAKVNAAKYVQDQLPFLMERLRNNNKEGAMELANSMKYNQAKKANAYWVAPETMDKLEAMLREGKKPLYSHNGAILEYQGTTGDTTLFKTKLF